MNLTDDEYAALENANTLQAWDDACDAVKKARGGRDYLPDWYVRVIAPGLLAKLTARIGGSADIHFGVRR